MDHLDIRDTTVKDSGVYTCIATNPEGSVQKMFHVTVQGIFVNHVNIVE